MRSKEQSAAAEKVQKLQSQLMKLRTEIDGNRAKMVNDPMSDQIANAITTGQIKLEAVNKALDNALDEQRRLETEALQSEARAQQKHIDELEKKAERDKQAAYNAMQALKADLDALYQSAVEHNRLTTKYQGKRGYIGNRDFKFLWRLNDQIAKIQKERRFIENMSKPPGTVKPQFTQLQKDVHAARYHAPDEGARVMLLENDTGTGSPVYRVVK